MTVGDSVWYLKKTRSGVVPKCAEIIKMYRSQKTIMVHLLNCGARPVTECYATFEEAVEKMKQC